MEIPLASFDHRIKSFMSQPGFDKKRLQISVEIRKNKRRISISKKRSSWAAISRYSPVPMNLTSRQTISKEETLLELLREFHNSQSLEKTNELLDVFYRLILTDCPRYIQFMISEGLLKSIIALLSTTNTDTLRLATHCISQITHGNFYKEIDNDKGIPPLLALVGYSDYEVVSNAIISLSNLSYSCSVLRDKILSRNFHNILIDLIDTKDTKMLELIIWALICMVKDIPSPSYEVLSAINAQVSLFMSVESPKILEETLHLLKYLLECDKILPSQNLSRNQISKIIAMGPDKNQLLHLKVLGCLSAASDSQVQVLIEAGLLDRLETLWKDRNTLLCEEIIWTASNLTVASIHQLEYMVYHSFANCIVEAVAFPALEVRKIAGILLSNIGELGKEQHLVHLASLGLFFSLKDVFHRKENQGFLFNCLEFCTKALSYSSLVHSFQDSGVIESIENLKYHENTTICDLASDILNNFYN